MSEKRIRPRSLENYPEEVRVAARNLYAEMYFIKDEEPYKVIRECVRNGDFDNYEPVKMAAFIVNKIRESEAGVKCHGCGSSWSEERLHDEKDKRPALLSCCPERKSRPVFWCEFAQ